MSVQPVIVLHLWERVDLLNRIAQLISQAWHTDDIRRSRPTPIDEAKWGFAVIENSLWHAVPRFLREFGEDVKAELDLELPIDFSPIEPVICWTKYATASRCKHMVIVVSGKCKGSS